MPSSTLRRGYAEIADDLTKRIEAGEFKAGAPIPPLDALVKHYGVARMTAHRAVSSLCAADKLEAVHGVGTFVPRRRELASIILVTRMDARQAGADPIRPISDVLASAAFACAEDGLAFITATEQQPPEKFLTRDHAVVLDYTSRDPAELAAWTRAVLDARAPYVSIGEDRGLPSYIGRDTIGGTRRALDYLHKLGHRRVGVLTRHCPIAGGPVIFPTPIEPPPGMDMRVAVQRYANDDREARHKLDCEALDAFFASPAPPTAILAGTGIVVQSALRYCADRGIRVPQDCSVMGYCRDLFALWNGRAITRVDNPFSAIAILAVKEAARLARQRGRAPRRQTLTPCFLDGETCGPPPR